MIENKVFLTETEGDAMVLRAKNLAQQLHEGKFRDDGRTYFEGHLVEVVKILTEEFGINNWKVKAAGFLHDTLEDTKITFEELKAYMGEEVALLVDGVTQLENDDEGTKKKVITRAIDLRVIFLKLADRLHNMRTLQFRPENKRAPKAKETLDTYVPLADSIGMFVIKKKLEDLSFKYLMPEEYEEWEQKVQNDLRTSNLFLEHFSSSLIAATSDTKMHTTVNEKSNSLWVIRQKCEWVPGIENINDVVSYSIEVDDGANENDVRNECYKILGKLRKIYGENEIIEKFKDSYSTPKENGYSAIQMTVNTVHGPVEIAITSKSKGEFNDWGVASLMRKGQEDLSKYALKLIFTPSGEVKFLRQKATGLDIAYNISTNLGAQAESITVDGVEHSLSYVVPNGATVRVNAGPNKIAPDKELLNYSLPATRRKIEEQYDNLKREKVAQKGKLIVEEILIEKAGLLDLDDLNSFDQFKLSLTYLLNNLGCKGSLSSLYFMIGMGYKSRNALINELEANGITKENLNLSTIRVSGVDGEGILRDISAILTDSGGNIGAIDLVRHGNIFSLRFVVEKLDKNSKAEIAHEIEKRLNIDKENILII